MKMSAWTMARQVANYTRHSASRSARLIHLRRRHRHRQEQAGGGDRQEQASGGDHQEQAGGGEHHEQDGYYAEHHEQDGGNHHEQSDDTDDPYRCYFPDDDDDDDDDYEPGVNFWEDPLSPGSWHSYQGFLLFASAYGLCIYGSFKLGERHRDQAKAKIKARVLDAADRRI